MNTLGEALREIELLLKAGQHWMAEQINSDICSALAAGADARDFYVREYPFDLLRMDLIYNEQVWSSYRFTF